MNWYGIPLTEIVRYCSDQPAKIQHMNILKSVGHRSTVPSSPPNKILSPILPGYMTEL